MSFKGHPYSNGYVYCDDCGDEHIETHEVLYHCRQCETDLCRACALKKAKVLSGQLQIAIHEHTLKWQSNKDGELPFGQHRWKCCVPNVGSQFISLPCEHGSVISIDRINEIATQRWHCEQCRWNFCLKCCLKYAYTDPSTIEGEDYESCYFFV